VDVEVHEPPELVAHLLAPSERLRRAAAAPGGIVPVPAPNEGELARLYEHIACCVDESEASGRALAEARRLHDVGGGRLSIVHSVAPPALYGGAYDPADPTLPADEVEWFRDLVAGVPGAEAVLLQGHAADTVVTWAEDAGVDLIVAAAHRGLVERMLLGGFAAYLAYHAPCPVLLARERERRAR
jgi:nucleotide-binding universal stress UspA family protein